MLQNLKTWAGHIWKTDYRGTPTLTVLWSIVRWYAQKWKICKRVQIAWYHYQGALPAPTHTVQHQTLIKAPTREVSYQSPVCPQPPNDFPQEVSTDILFFIQRKKILHLPLTLELLILGIGGIEYLHQVQCLMDLNCKSVVYTQIIIIKIWRIQRGIWIVYV